jgi:hypothetical protein
MAQRPKGVQSWSWDSVVDGPLLDTVIKANRGILYDVTVTWTACDIDDRLVIHDAATADTSAKKIFAMRFATAAGTFTARLADVGREALIGLFVNAQLKAASKVDISIGFD